MAAKQESHQKLNTEVNPIPTGAIQTDEFAPPQQQEQDGLSPRERFLLRQKQRSKAMSPKDKKARNSEKSPKSTSNTSPRQWEEGKTTKQDMNMLDLSKKISERKGQISEENDQAPDFSKYVDERPDHEIGGEQFVDSDTEEKTELQNASNRAVKTLTSAPTSFLGRWVGKIKTIVGGADQTLVAKDQLDLLIADLRIRLLTKNVASAAADSLLDSITKQLLNKPIQTGALPDTLHSLISSSLRSMLTPSRPLNLPLAVNRYREQHMKPYVIAFVGVNGVGKSTSLAKVAYKLKQASLSVMLVACDTFRAGAVQQIQVHGRNLDIPVFQRGYKEQPGKVAYQAVKMATRRRIDAVLIDTAGRMQDNTQLMKQLANLVSLSKPNLVVFIGQALVGNDSVDQVTKFNKALKDGWIGGNFGHQGSYGMGQQGQNEMDNYVPQIDAILLSKFDTVDDKVGTAISLVYATGKPILYVGVGQKYNHLKELNVSTVVKALLN